MWPGVAAAVLVALAVAAIVWWRPGAPENGTIRTLAVLPFENVGGDPNTEYLSEGLADHVINSLTAAQPGTLRVRPFASVARFRSRPVDTREVAKALDVDALVFGSVRQQGDELAISVALVDAREDSQLWGDRYTSRLSDILGVQDRFARDIASNLRLRLTEEEAGRLVRRDTNDPEAYLLYRQGLHEFNRFSIEGLQAARDLFQRALQRDPQYVTALAGVARTYVLLGTIHLGPKATHPEALRVLQQVRAMDPEHPEVRVQEGIIHLFYDWNWQAAERAFDPTDLSGAELLMTVWNMHGFLLGARGRLRESLDAIQRGNEIEPLSAPRRAELAQARLLLGDLDGAEADARRALELNPFFFLAQHHLGVALVLDGRFDEAIAAFEKGLAIAPQQALLRGGVAVAHARAGRTEAARAIAEEMAGWSPRANRAVAIAHIHTALGDHDRALTWLRQAADDRDTFFIWVRSDRLLADVAKDPRFEGLLIEVGLPR
jgi:TolB-like protein/Flp pilus assembly protein TadD